MNLLFQKQDLPRTPSIKRMHVVDAGMTNGHVHMVCDHCGYDDEFKFIYDNTLTELKRGLPCPECNQSKAGQS